MNTPVPYMGMSQQEYAAEQRLQKLEEVTVQFAAHTAAEEFRFEMISNQIADLSKSMDKFSNMVQEKMGEISDKVEALKVQQDDHHKYLMTLQQEQKKAKERRKSIIKGFAWGGMAAFGAFLAKFGETIYNWMFGSK